MKKYIPVYYLLCVLLILGAFAAMAQNRYGLTLLGLVAGLFAIVFFIQLVSNMDVLSRNRDYLGLAEYMSLILLSTILCLRVFFIRFAFVEEIFILAGLLLIVTYIIRAVLTFRSLVLQHKPVARTVALFHLSIIFYILSMVLAPLYPRFSEPAGIAAFLLLIVFTLSAIYQGKILIDGEKQTIFSIINRFRDHAIILIATFLIFTGYMGLTKIGVVPKMYTDEYPQAYFDLVKRAETGMESPVNGKYKHEEFKEMYDRFVERNSSTESQ